MNIRLLTNIILIICGSVAAGVLVLLFFVIDDFHAKIEPGTGILVSKRQIYPIKKNNHYYQNTRQKKNDSLNCFSDQLFYFNVAIDVDTITLKIIPSVYFKKQIGDTLALLKATGHFSNKVVYFAKEE